ncbi:MAG: RDD family protein [Granulosicoccus sp.]|nr:RDD family protein [Granulosicoccus sp.]
MSDLAQVSADRQFPVLAGEHIDKKAWARFFARFIDFTLFSLVIEIALLAIVPQWYSSVSDLVLFSGEVVSWILVETLLLLRWGTTPGKKFLKIKLRKSDDSALQFGSTFLRSMRVAWRGLALGLPLIYILALLRSCLVLRSDGITSWDKDGGYEVDHKPIGPVRIALAIIFYLIYCSLIVLGVFMDL